MNLSPSSLRAYGVKKIITSFDPADLNDADFKELSKAQGFVWTLADFQKHFNDGLVGHKIFSLRFFDAPAGAPSSPVLEGPRLEVP